MTMAMALFPLQWDEVGQQWEMAQMLLQIPLCLKFSI
jgi:hypothetical protein